MFATVVLTFGLLAQASPAVRVSREDSMLYVQSRAPGHLMLLHVDAIGRIAVLYPSAPDEITKVSGTDPLAIVLPPTAQANPATFIAVRSRWPFDFAVLRVGSSWDYQNAWLLQPSAGDPLAALLDIADRITDGRPYDYGVAAYSRQGTLLAREQPLQPDVCLGCVRPGRAAVVASGPGPLQPNTVDCSSASLTNSFCGVASAPVTITSPPQVAVQPAPAPAPAPVYVVPYYLPIFVDDGLHDFRPHQPPMPPAGGGGASGRSSSGAAYPIAPRTIVPSSTDLRTFSRRRS